MFMKYSDIKESFTLILNKTVRSITQVENGITNFNYLINNAYIFRKINPNRDQSLSFKDEKEVIKLLEKMPFTEKVLYFNEEDGTKISRYIHFSRSYKDTPTREQLFLVAKLIRKFQKLNLKVSFEYDAIKKLELYKAVLNQDNNKEFIPVVYENKVISEYEKISKLYPLVLSHNDLVKNNILFTFNKVYFIDWEYAGMNNALFDVASFISENNLNDEQKEYFLKIVYGAKLNNLLTKRINLVTKFQDILFYYRALYSFKLNHRDIYKKIADEKFNKIKATNFVLN